MSIRKIIGRFILPILLMVLLGSAGRNALAQGGTYPIIQLSGVVLQPDSSGGVAGAHIYVPKAGRGTSSDHFGYFSLPVLARDSVIISCVGYRKFNYVVPGNKGDHLTIIISLQQDTTYLPELEVFPYPTEELLKEAIVNMNLPDQSDRDAINQNLNERLMAEMFKSMPMDAGMNYRNYMNQRVIYANDGYGPRYNPLLNPFAWAQFFKALKRGDFKSQQ